MKKIGESKTENHDQIKMDYTRNFENKKISHLRLSKITKISKHEQDRKDGMKYIGIEIPIFKTCLQNAK